VSRGDSQRRSVKGLALGVLAAACLLLAPADSWAAEGSISGTVKEAGSSNTVGGVAVCAALLGGGTPRRQTLVGCAQTPADGTYTIGSLPAGEYAVLFEGEPRGYFFQYYDGKSSTEEPTPVTVGTADVPNIDAELVRGGQIAGVVKAAASGEPVEGVGVCAWTLTGQLSRCAITGLQGAYMVGPLQEGMYKVEFSPESSLAWTLLPEFYSNKATMAEADPVLVELGRIRTGIDAMLEATPEPPPSTPANPVESLPPPPFVIETASQPQAPPLKCRKGFRKRRVNGKLRCVRVKHRHRHRRHHHHSSPR